MKMLKVLFVVILVSFGGPAAAQSLQNDIVYGAQGQTLDLYVPDAEKRKTALLFIHGGGFREGNKLQLAGLAKLYAKGGFVSATMNYRLAPAFPYPAAIEDVKSAVRWLKSNGAEKVVLVGYSAGGTLALSAGLPRDIQVAAIVSVAAAADLDSWAASVAFPQAKVDVANYLNGALSREASPLYAVRSGAPPVFLFHGDDDQLVPIAQSVMMAERLKAKKVPVLFRVVSKAGHDVLLTPKHVKAVLKDLTPFLVGVDRDKR